MDKGVTIEIPRELYQRLAQMILGTGFASVNEFIVFVMRTLASNGEIREQNRLTAEEARAIGERLRKLGYLKEKGWKKSRKGKSCLCPLSFTGG